MTATKQWKKWRRGSRNKSENRATPSIVYPRLESAMDASALKSVEMLQFLNEEKQRAMINELVGKIRSSCWDKYIGTM
nr:mitochondrial import inner membrane translocase subunit TIM8 [Ipomoea trifida]